MANITVVKRRKKADVEAEDIKVDVELRPLSDFTKKDALEEYGLTLGINLNKTKKLENMYDDLVEFVK